MKLKSLLFLFIAVISLCLPPNASAEPLRIGVIVPLSGPGALWGKHLRRGAELAARPDGSAGTVAPKLVFEDDHLDGAAAVTAYRKLAQDNISVFIVFGSQSANSVIPLAEKNHHLVMAITSDPRPVIDRNYAFRIAIDAAQQADRLTELFLKRKIQRIALLSTTHDSMLEMATKLAERATAAGIKVVYREEFSKGETDFHTIVTKVKQVKPDAVVNSLLPPSLSAYATQSQGILKGVPQFGFSQADNLEEIAAAPIALEKMIFPRVTVSDDFQRMYQSEFGEDPQSYAAYAYDLVTISAKLHRQGARTVPEFVSAIHALKEYHGASGKLSVNSQNSIDTRALLCVVRNGRIERLS